MGLNTLWHRWFGWSRPLFSSRNQRRLAQQRPRFRPRLEALEERTLLSGNLPFADPTTAAQLVQDITYVNQNPGSYTITLPATTSPYVLDLDFCKVEASCQGIGTGVNIR